MSTEYVDQRLVELGLSRRAADLGNPVKIRARQLRRRRAAYEAGIAPPETCELCGKDPRAARRGNQSLCLDHDHATGAFRGWLCHACNLGIGLLGDTEERLARAVRYLKRKAAKPGPPSVRLASMLAAAANITPK